MAYPYKNLQPGQFFTMPMFLTAEELHNEVVPADDPTRPREVMAEKLAEAKAGPEENTYEDMRFSESGRTLHQSIAQEGVREPVTIGRAKDVLIGDSIPDAFAIYDGHHRVASQNALDPKALIPVEWEDWGR